MGMFQSVQDTQGLLNGFRPDQAKFLYFPLSLLAISQAMYLYMVLHPQFGIRVAIPALTLLSLGTATMMHRAAVRRIMARPLTSQLRPLTQVTRLALPMQQAQSS